MHCALGCHNLLVAPDGAVAAILGWEMAKIGNPATYQSTSRHGCDQVCS
nr:hypothetical protein JVH1_9115 [Rhodococcus sp. JVH1]